MSGTFEFDSDLQSLIAALVLRDSDFNSRVEGLIDPGYFTDELEAGLVSLWQTYFAAYKSVPKSGAVAAALLAKGLKAKILHPSRKDDVVDRYRELMALDIADRDFVIEQVEVFARHQAMAHAVLESVDLISAGNYGKVEELIKKAGQVSASDDSGAYVYFDEIESRRLKREEIASGKRGFDGIPTGIELLDAHLFHRGWGRKELTLIMGGAKAGKTTALIDAARACSMNGLSALYVTLEVSSEIVAERLDANISEFNYSALISGALDVEKRINAAKAKAGPLIIHEYPSGTLTPAGLSRLVNKYKADGMTFDLIVVDYADLMAPNHRNTEARENSREIYIDLRAIAQEHNAAMLSATQTNREGMKAAVQRMEHVAEDINKVRTADLLITLNQTEDEKVSKQMRLFLAASRNQADGICIRIEQALERGKFVAKVLGIEAV
tara:strand:- start:4165 stop:5484 length:1320 start_codon:yes stop_codon:yes gene_type:complete